MPDIYGLPGLSRDDLAKVKMGTLLAVRAAAACHAGDRIAIPWVSETPLVKPDPEKPSVFKLPEWQKLACPPHGARCDIDQCMVGSPSTKPTTLLSSRVCLDHLRLKCEHPI